MSPTHPSSSTGAATVPHPSPTPRNLRAASLSALVLLVVGGCVARMLIDEGLGNAPLPAALVLLVLLVALAFWRGPYVALLAFVMLPALFGAAPWNSPVRANLGGVDLPLYLFDLVMLVLATVGFVVAWRRPNSDGGRFLRRHWLLLLVICASILIKIAESGPAGDVLRNAALFYYFPAVFFASAALAPRVDLKQLVPGTYLRMLVLTAVAPLVVLLGIAVGARDLVLVSIHQGMVEPAGALSWLPPGSLVLLSFCAAAFLFDAKTAWRWKVVIIVLLAYDFLTYWNRAMWLGIAVGVAIQWVIVRGWRRGVLPAVLAVAVASAGFSTLREALREGHNESSEWRLLAWGLTAAAIVERPLFGHTYGESLLAQVLAAPESLQAMSEADLAINAQARSPHNSYLSLIFFGGVIQGGAVLLFIVVTLLSLGRQMVRARRRGQASTAAEAVFRGSVAIAVYSALNVVLETPIEGITYWLVMFIAWCWAEHFRSMPERRS